MIAAYLIVIAAWPAIQVPPSRYIDAVEKRWVLFVPPDETLHWAVNRNEMGRVREMVEAGVNVNRRDMRGMTPLHIAVSFGHVELARYLIERGADLDRRAFYVKSRTPLHIAAYHGELAVARVLIEAGAEVDARDEEGSTPLLLAASSGHGELIEFLVGHGADIKARQMFGYGALHWPPDRRVQSRAYDRVVRLFVTKGGDLNARDDWDTTGLIQASSLGASSETLEFMIANGADPAAVDRSGRTAADRARWDAEAFFAKLEVKGKRSD